MMSKVGQKVDLISEVIKIFALAFLKPTSKSAWPIFSLHSFSTCYIFRFFFPFSIPRPLSPLVYICDFIKKKVKYEFRTIKCKKFGVNKKVNSVWRCFRWHLGGTFDLTNIFWQQFFSRINLVQAFSSILWFANGKFHLIFFKKQDQIFF